MLPNKLTGIYAEYKQDTNIVASWLASCARLCQYPTEKLSGGSWDLDTSKEAQKPSRRPKGKARGQARQATAPGSATAPVATCTPRRYILAVADFVPLAEFIVRSMKPSISISPAVVSALNRAISARSNFGQLLSKHQDIEHERNAASDSTHRHFVGILEEVRKILVSKVPPVSSDTDEVDVIQDLTNRYDHLEIQVPSPDVPNAEPRSKKARDKRECAATISDTTEYVAEEPSSFSDAIAAYGMLFHDIATIRDAVKNIWTGVRDKTIDYAAAAIATDAAIGMIQDLAETVRSVMEPHGGILKIMIEVLIRWQNEKCERSPEEKYELALHHCLVPVLGLSRLMEILKSRRPDDVFCFPSPHALSDDDTISGVGFQADFRWLLCCQADGSILAQCLAEEGESYPAKDMFVQGIRDMVTYKALPFYTIIAAQVNLDIHHVLARKTEDVTDEALRELKGMKKDLASYLEIHGDDAVLEHRLNLLRLVLADPVKVMNDHLRADNGPRSQAHQMFKLFPVLTGQLVHHFRAAVYKDAISVANKWGSIQYAVQLYHALRTEGLVKTAWPDLDHVRTMLGESNFFVGPPPKSNPEYMAKFFLHAGLSTAARAKQARNKKGKKGDRTTTARETDRSQYTSAGPRTIADGDDRLPLSKKFIKLSESRWNMEMEGRARSDEFLRDIIADVDAINPNNKTQCGSKHSNHIEGENEPGFRSVLLKLTGALHDESRILRFPLLKVHQTSWEFLTTVRDKCGPLLRGYFRGADFEADDLTWFTPGYIFSAACREGDKNRIGLPMKQRPDLGPLRLAGEICERLLTERKDFGTRALRWMEGEGEEDAQGQEGEDTSVEEHQEVKDTGQDDGNMDRQDVL